MPFMNILLMGATRVGKSSLINALFGKEIAKAGIGESVTQHLNKAC
nr:GTPase [Helicobacter pylori]